MSWARVAPGQLSISPIAGPGIHWVKETDRGRCWLTIGFPNKPLFLGDSLAHTNAPNVAVLPDLLPAFFTSWRGDGDPLKGKRGSPRAVGVCLGMSHELTQNETPVNLGTRYAPGWAER